MAVNPPTPPTHLLASILGASPEDRFEVAMRATAVVLGLVTLFLALAPGIHAHVAAPAVDLALDTVAAVVCGTLTTLAWVRFRERREAIALYHSAAFIALATAYIIAVAVSLGRDGALETLRDPSSAQAWVFAVARVVAAVLLILGGMAVEVRGALRHPKLLLVLPALLVLAIAVIGHRLDAIPPSLNLLESGSDADLLPNVTPLGLVVQAATATLFFAAALACRAAWRRDRVVIDAWIALGLVFAGFAEIQWALYPSGHPGQVSTADLLRLAFFIALLLGIEAEARVTVIRLRTANQELAMLRDMEVERAAAEERARLARELHDGLAQDLWLAKMKTGQAAAVRGLPRSAGPLLSEAEAAIDKGLTEARQAVLALRLSSNADEGFCSLITRYVEDFEDRFGLRVEFTCVGDSGVVAARTQAEVLRIAQEALTNARQHAGATVVGVRLMVRGGRVSLRVVDNGCGFDVGRSAASDSFGLLSMRERAALIGGRLQVRSRPGHGTAVLLSAPATNQRPTLPSIPQGVP
jgi:signal transduction histidine kinase